MQCTLAASHKLTCSHEACHVGMKVPALNPPVACVCVYVCVCVCVHRQPDHALFQTDAPDQFPTSTTAVPTLPGPGGPNPAANTSSSSSPIDNPDQRICDDIAGYVRSSTDIALSLVKKILNCAAFASECGM